MKKKEPELEAKIILIANEVRRQGERIEKLEQNCERLREGVNAALEAIRGVNEVSGNHEQAINNLAETVKRQEAIITKHDDALLKAEILEEKGEDEEPPGQVH